MWGGSSQPANLTETEEESITSYTLDVFSHTLQFEWEAFASGYECFLDSMVHTRMEEVPAGEAGMRAPDTAPQSFGPWSAHKDEDATDAPSDGSISEWYDSYYITHDWSEYGRAILSMQTGDTVRINSITMVVEQVFDYPKNSYYEEIMWAAGEDAAVLQTCVPGRDFNRHVCGRVVQVG